MYREAQELHRININENTLGLMPDKAINLALKVQRKRNSMNAQMDKMGIGKTFANQKQVSKIKNVKRRTKIPYDSPRDFSSDSEILSSDSRMRTNVSTLLDKKFKDHSQPPMLKERRIKQYRRLSTEGDERAKSRDRGSKLLNYQIPQHKVDINMKTLAQKQAFINDYEKVNIVIEKVKSDDSQHLKQKKDIELPYKANQGNLAKFFKRMLLLPNKTIKQKQPIFKRQKNVQIPVQDMKVLGKTQPIYRIPKEQSYQAEKDKREQYGLCGISKINKAIDSIEELEKNVNKGTSTFSIDNENEDHLPAVSPTTQLLVTDISAPAL